MPFNPKPNTGIISKNSRKEEGKNHPDQAGNVLVLCPHCDKTADYWLNGWVRDGKWGKFLSLSLKPKVEKRDERPMSEIMDDEIGW